MTPQTKWAVIAVVAACVSLAAGRAIWQWNRVRCPLRVSFAAEGGVLRTLPRGQYELTLVAEGYRSDCTINLPSSPKFPVETQLQCTGDPVGAVWQSWDLLAVVLQRTPDWVDIGISRNGSVVSEQRVLPRREHGNCSAVIALPSNWN